MTGAKIRQWCKNSPLNKKSKIFSIFKDVLSVATSDLMEKLPLNYFKNLFGSTASRAQSGAKDGFWRVIANANSVNTDRFVLKPKNKLSAEKNWRQAMERKVNFPVENYETYEKRSKNNAHYKRRFGLALSLESLLEID